MTTLYFTHDAFLEHDTGPGHPERADRLRAVAKVMEHEAFDALDRREANEAPLEPIARAHPQAFVDAILKIAPSDQSIRIDGDTVMSPGSLEAVRRAVGAGLQSVDAVMTQDKTNSFCAVRPPGHHAEATVAMGFCIFNSVAVAAHYARDKYDAERIAVVDFDVHHGNGTQDIFKDDPDLFYASSHQMPLFPGSGARSETGVGNIVNAPLNAGDGSAHFREAWKDVVLPQLKAFNPDLLIISAGFDAHHLDPLANINLEAEDFVWLTQHLVEIADNVCEGRVVSMLEGGYDLTGLSQSVAGHVKILMDAAS